MPRNRRIPPSAQSRKYSGASTSPYSLVSSAKLADSGKVRVNRSGLLLPESTEPNQACRNRSALLTIRAIDGTPRVPQRL